MEEGWAGGLCGQFIGAIIGAVPQSPGAVSAIGVLVLLAGNQGADEVHAQGATN